MGSGEGSTMTNFIVCFVHRMIKSRRSRWAGPVARMEEGRTAFKISTDKPTGKRPLGKSRRRCEDNMRMALKAIGINMRN